MDLTEPQAGSDLGAISTRYQCERVTEAVSITLLQGRAHSAAERSLL